MKIRRYKIIRTYCWWSFSSRDHLFQRLMIGYFQMGSCIYFWKNVIFKWSSSQHYTIIKFCSLQPDHDAERLESHWRLSSISFFSVIFLNPSSNSNSDTFMVCQTDLNPLVKWKWKRGTAFQVLKLWYVQLWCTWVCYVSSLFSPLFSTFLITLILIPRNSRSSFRVPKR